jgi:ribose 5-phosphate isomerase A
MKIFEHALSLAPRSGVIGLGSGRAATAFVSALAEEVRAGRSAVRGVPTSTATAELAGRLGVPLLSLAEAGTLEVTFDGADEVDPGLEVVPFALPLCERKLRELGLDPVPYTADGRLFVTDNGNHILDCRTGPIDDPARLEAAIRAIPGVVGTGLFLGNFELIEERRRP